jgi:hypothetical protein
MPSGGCQFPSESRGVSFRQEKDRGSQAEGRTCLEDQKGRRLATAVIASKAEWREVDLPVLWERRLRTIVQEEAGRALPRLLQAALRFGRTPSEGPAHAQGEGCEVVHGVEIELRAGLREGLGLSRVFRPGCVLHRLFRLPASPAKVATHPTASTILSKLAEAVAHLAQIELRLLESSKMSALV